MKLINTCHGYPGKLAVIEGHDGSGKTTVEEELQKYFLARGIPVVRTYQPSDWWRRNPYLISSLRNESYEGIKLCDEAIAMFSVADRLNHQINVITPMLEEGKLVLCNRYIYSLFSYYIARGTIDLHWLVELSRPIYKPDLTIVLTASPETLVSRVISRDGPDSRAYDQNFEFVNKTIEAYEQLIKNNNLSEVSSQRIVSDTVRDCIDCVKNFLCREVL